VREHYEDLETYERGKNMPYISAIERMGEARGEARGKIEGKVELIGLLLAHQVGTIAADTAEEIKKLSIEQLDRLALDLRGFTSVIDLTNWLQQKN
jgi:predicted transposase YdaD